MPQKKLGLLLAVEPNTSPAELNPRPQVLLLNWCRNSRADPSDFMRNTPDPKRLCSPPTVPLKEEYPTVPQIQLSKP